MSEKLSRRDRFTALLRAGGYRPKLAVVAIALSVFSAAFEGVGLGFILPIIELARGDIDPTEASGILGTFAEAYLALGLPFTLGYLIVGVAAILSIRYVTSFLVGWLRGAIRTYYTAYLQEQAFTRATVAETSYFDQEGSDDILNAIVTQAEYAGQSLNAIIRIIQETLLSLMYFSIALYVAPRLTLVTTVLFGAISYLFNNVLESGYNLGGKVADANERIQQAAQAGTQGIRDVKLFRLRSELLDSFTGAVTQFRTASVKSARNAAAIQNFYQLLTAIAIFVLIYVGLTYSSLSLSSLGVFLFALFRLGPRVSTLNHLFYNLDTRLPHLVRTQEFIDELERNQEMQAGGSSVPDRIHSVRFEDVTFAYEVGDETVLEEVSFGVERGEFVAFVGPSGAGKSTIVSLLARLYSPDAGQITANETDISEFDVDEWRSKVAVVRQDPHIFNESLRRNLTIGNRDASQAEIDRACEIAHVSEFFDSLPNGYETRLGDDGVRLSGGQRQRVALARALLVDADVLVLDEATSDLDIGIERNVQEAIESMDRDYALLTIAHRLSTVRNADRIYSMDDGRITEVGRHDELIDADGTYAELYSSQRENL
ncbi:ABC transporter ATP-binding protein [Haloarcula salina]|uniref:ABC transporter ATP-binding protein/permease n=1 Tax=Haloarcula salina TaxID=1429914 RepID=A0AA41KB13_9EURY|nr:ABC transporter ATP-binding protein [Haloarcula salina]MBV0900415.1 ABC transporter ATP-binding protein/permease [Haloarcula salina]